MKPIKIIFLGIDGSGKSTLARMLAEYLEARGFYVTLVPFHKWVFADFFRDRLKVGRILDRNRKPRKTSYYAPQKASLSGMIKPPIALFDNILLYLLNRPRYKNEVYIYDRFISATQIKMAALNYRTQWLRGLWGSIKTPFTFYIDIDPETSLTRQVSRKDPYTYPVEILKKERQEYLRLAKNHKYTIIRNDRSIKAAFADLINSLCF